VRDDQSRTSINCSFADQEVANSFHKVTEFSPTTVDTQHATTNSTSHSVEDALNFDFQDQPLSAVFQNDNIQAPNTE
jgi:hypothetical protein